ncbi:MAG: conjugal transfer protein TraF [Desulfobulbaceae bacterium]
MPTRFSTRPCRSGDLIRLSLICCLIIYSTQAWAGPVANAADTQDIGNRFYDDPKHGWFWYEDPPPELEEQPEHPEIAPDEKKTVSTPRKVPSLDTYTIDELWTMHPDEFQGLLNDLQKKAVQAPTEQNILEYLTMQDVARRKALAYTNAVQYVTQKHTGLFNINQVYPVAGPGVSARVQLQQDEISGTINGARDDHALIMFTSHGCPYCVKQGQILTYFAERYGWQSKTVDISRQPQAAARFNITVTPTLLLIKRGQDTSMPVATGVITLSELERKLYQAIRYLRGQTSMDSFMTYDFQKGGAFDPPSILEKKQPWKNAP